MQNGVHEISPAALAAALRDGAVVIDVREPHEYESGHVPAARSMPASAVVQGCADLPKHEPVYVICAAGNRSRTVAERLARTGLDARTVAGGTQAWIAAGFPLVHGPRADRP